MSEYLPSIFERFREQFPDVDASLEALAVAVRAAGPLEGATYRLVKLGIAVGAVAEGAVRSNVRKALDDGLDPDLLRQVAMMAITTRGFPASIAALGWVEEVLSEQT